MRPASSISGDLAKLDERQRFLLDNRQTVLAEQSRLAEEFKIAGERISAAENEAATLLREFDEAREQADASQVALNERLAEKAALELDLDAARKRMEELSNQRAGIQAHLDELGSRTGTQEQKLESIIHAIEQHEKDARLYANDFKAAGEIRQKSEAAIHSAEKELLAAQDRLSNMEENIKRRSAETSAKKAEQARLKAQLDVLDQSEQSLTGYADGAKILLEAARQSRLNGTPRCAVFCAGCPSRSGSGDLGCAW